MESVKKRFDLAVARCNDLALGRFYCRTKTKYALRKGLVRNVFKLYSLAAKRSCDNAIICYVCIFSLCFDSLCRLFSLFCLAFGRLVLVSYLLVVGAEKPSKSECNAHCYSH